MRLADSGDVISLCEKSVTVEDRVPVGRVFVDADLGEVDWEILRDRRRIAGGGIVVPVVAVDRETGAAEVLRHVSVGDAGRALNPAQVEGQDDGAAVMGLGHAFMEHLIHDDTGRIRNLGAVDYRIPTIKDMPGELRCVSIENADGPGPYGAKGISEGALLANASAVGTAVNKLIGATIRDLPLTPERVWRAMKEGE